jgi:(p)ppGpp synthase/HD superfamily hydrolase
MSLDGGPQRAAVYYQETFPFMSANAIISKRSEDGMWNTDLYYETLDFAAAAHEGQTVPGKAYAYVVHLADICSEVLRAAIIENIEDPNLAMQCALLHKVMEDTAVTHAILCDRFGQEVADGVQALTMNNSLPEKKRHLDGVHRVKLQKTEVWLVKLADAITILRDPPDFWDKEKRLQVMQEARAIRAALGKGSPYLSARLHDVLFYYKQQLIKASQVKKPPRRR